MPSPPTMTGTAATVCLRRGRSFFSRSSASSSIIPARSSSSSSSKSHNNDHDCLKTWAGDTSSTDAPINTTPLTLSGSTYLLPTLRPSRNHTPGTIRQQIVGISERRRREKNTNAPVPIPIILDLSDWKPDGSPHYKPPTTASFQNLIRALTTDGALSVLGIAESNSVRGDFAEAVRGLGLPSVMTVPPRGARRPDRTRPQNMRSPTESSSAPRSKVHRGHVRSGQQISAEGCNLVILGSVHSGGEVISDGDIHIYGKLKGRAMAGLSKEDTPGHFIFASHFDPELVCIGGSFRTGDNVRDLGLAGNDEGVMVSLNKENGELVFESIDY